MAVSSIWYYNETAQTSLIFKNWRIVVVLPPFLHSFTSDQQQYKFLAIQRFEFFCGSVGLNKETPFYGYYKQRVKAKCKFI